MNTKNIIKGSLVAAAIVAFAAGNVSISLNKTNKLSLRALANMEALAGEYDGSYNWYENRGDEYDSIGKCYRQCVSDGGGCAYMNNFPYNC